jgi:hypothetical protein
MRRRPFALLAFFVGLNVVVVVVVMLVDNRRKEDGGEAGEQQIQQFPCDFFFSFV